MQRRIAERELTPEGPTQRAPGRGGRSVAVNLAESPLTWLHARGHLSDGQFAAGERLRADWERAQLAPSVTMRWVCSASLRILPAIKSTTLSVAGSA